MAGFFITDAGAAKTWATLALMRWLQVRGLSVIGMKPVATGWFFYDGELGNEDAMILQENASVSIDYAKLNIYAFKPPVSPHIAARMAGTVVQFCEIAMRWFDPALAVRVGSPTT